MCATFAASNGFRLAESVRRTASPRTIPQTATSKPASTRRCARATTDVARLPPQQDSPSTWHGPDMLARRDEWLVHLSAADIQEMEAALLAAAKVHDWAQTAVNAPKKRGYSNHGAQKQLSFNSSNAPPAAIEFPLPTLGPRLKDIRQELIHGRGFAVLRGLPVEEYSVEKASAIFFGLGSHVGSARPQNAAGDVIGHVRDFGLSSTDANVRIYQTRERQTFHTDSADVVGLLCLRPARRGGDSLLVSASAIFNEMRSRHPHLAAALLEPIATDRRGEVPAGQDPFFLIPFLSYFQEYLTVMYQRQYIESAQRFEAAPRLTPTVVEALDLFDALANSAEFNFSMRLRPGDVQLVYNHGLLHDRTAFEDWPEPERRRHLLRLWLAVPGDRPLPDVFASRFGSVEVGNRGGVVVARA